jgi:hypothetical protein
VALSSQAEALADTGTALHPVTGHRFDYVISLCDKVREICPDFADHPRRATGASPTSAAAGDTDQAS